MKLNELKPNKGSRPKLVRVGRGHGSGLGQQAGKGHKGQQSRSGGTGVPYKGFEGGQNPLYKRSPKLKRFRPHDRIEYAVVNVGELATFAAGTLINKESLVIAGLVRKTAKYVKILGNGELAVALKINVHACSDTAKAKIESAKGSVELLKIKVTVAK